MAKLNISRQLSLQVDEFVTSTQAILAKKGSGKSYTASVEAEELLAAHQQIVVVDPTGAWWGLRSSADGESAGHRIAVFGGEHGDLPLEATAGEVLADAIASDHFSAVLDLSMFRKGEANRFMGVFLETLYRKNRDALHLFIDEADTVAPQKPYGDEARTLGATEDIVRRGRIRGIGCTLITQRPQVLSKNVLSQVDMLTALRMNHPKDIAAIKEWVNVHADEGQAKDMIESLPSLPIGDAWLWKPDSDLFRRVTIRRRKTFDSGRTPKVGERHVVPKALATVDLEKLGKSIAATVEKVKANDPKALKARVAELELQLRKQPAAPAARAPRVVEKQIVSDASLARIEKLIAKADALVSRTADVGAELDDHLAQLRSVVAAASERPTSSVPLLRLPPPIKAAPIKAKPANGAVSSGVKAWPGPPPTVNGTLVPAQQRVVDTLATLEFLDMPSSREVLAAWLGVHPRTKGFVNNVGALRSGGFVDEYALTAQGRAIANKPTAKTSEEVVELLLKPIPPAQRRILEVVRAHGSIGREELAAALGTHERTKGFTNNVGALRSRALLTDSWPIEAGDVFPAVSS